MLTEMSLQHSANTELVIDKTEAPANVTGCIVAPNGDVVVFKWVQVSDLDLAGYEIRYGKTGASSWADATPLTSVTRGTNVTSADVPPGTWDFYIKAVDTTDNYSTTETSSAGVLIESTRDVIEQNAQSPDWSNLPPADIYLVSEYSATQYGSINKLTTAGDGTKNNTFRFIVKRDVTQTERRS